MNWGNALQCVGRTEEAIAKYQQAHQLQPTYAPTLLNWGLALAELGQYDAAFAKFQQAHQLQPKESGFTSLFGILGRNCTLRTGLDKVNTFF